jgi:hypothetical protein
MAERPIRVQLSRAKGWRMPLNTVKVDRSTRWGNPFRPEQFWEAGYNGSLEVATANCVGAFKAWLLGDRHWAHAIPTPPTPYIAPLRGKNLACWCPLGSPCHADVLLELANAPVCEEAA